MSNTDKFVLKLFNKFDKSIGLWKNVFDKSFNKMKETILSEKNRNLVYLTSLKLKQFFSIGTNIGSTLIHGFKSNKQVSKHYNKTCNSTGCNSCAFMTGNCHAKINDIIFPFLKDCDCNSRGVIYLISCNKCNEHYSYYIGETERSASMRKKICS